MANNPQTPTSFTKSLFGKGTFWQFSLFILLLLIAVITYFVCNKSFGEQWGQWIDTYITLTTLCFALIIWFNEKRHSWIETLPKRLNITYQLNGQVYCKVLNAPLTGEGDIRGWGQSIAQTILNERSAIEFSGFKIQGPNLVEGKKVLEYELLVYLYKPIDKITAGKVYQFGEDGNLIK